MSKRKVDFGTPENVNKRPKTFGTQQHPVHIEMSGRTATLGYVTMLSLRLCSVTFALSASVRTSSLRVAVFLRKNL